MNASGLYTTTEVSKLMRTSDQTVRNWIEHGRVQAIRVGRRYLIPRAELQRLQVEQGPGAGRVTVGPHPATGAAAPRFRPPTNHQLG